MSYYTDAVNGIVLTRSLVVDRVATSWTRSCWVRSTTTEESTWCRQRPRDSISYGLSVPFARSQKTSSLRGASSSNWQKNCSEVSLCVKTVKPCPHLRLQSS